MSTSCLVTICKVDKLKKRTDVSSQKDSNGYNRLYMVNIRCKFCEFFSLFRPSIMLILFEDLE